MASSTMVVPQPRIEVSGRPERLVETLRSLAAEASPGLELPWALALADLADSAGEIDRQRADLPALAALVKALAATCEHIGSGLARQPLLAARRVNAALERLQVTRSWADALRAVPAELCSAGDFDRVLFSRLEGSTWVPATWHVATDRTSATNVAFGHFIHSARIPLANGMIEAEIVRRRVSALVTDAAAEQRTFRPLVEVAQVRSYVISPVISGNAVVGLIHADTFGTGRPLTEADRATMRSFADGVGLLLERLALQERLDLQRTRIAEALARAEQIIDDLCSAPVLLSEGPEVCGPTRLPAGEDHAAHDGLTTREREVFALLVSGATNSEIANRLTVSETTVKSHVKHILRKLRAANRAEAIAKYLAMGKGVRS